MGDGATPNGPATAPILDSTLLLVSFFSLTELSFSITYGELSYVERSSYHGAKLKPVTEN
jgi:hypothetical protein